MKKLLLLCLLAVLIPCLVWSQSQVIRRPIEAGAAGGYNYSTYTNTQGSWLFLASNCGGGSEWCDTSGKDNHMTAAGTPASSTTVPTGYSSTHAKSMVFNGTTDYLTRANANLSAQFPGKVQKINFAAAAWVRLTGVGTVSRIIMCNDEARGDFLSLNATEKPMLHWHDGTNHFEWSDTVHTFTAGVWYHIAMQFTGIAACGAGSGTAQLWVSTESTFETQTHTQAMTDVGCIMAWSGAFNIGRDSTYTTQYWYGEIFEPIILDDSFTNIATALGKADATAVVQEIWANGITGED